MSVLDPDKIAAPVYVLEPDEDDRPVCQYANKYALKMFGFREEDIIGRTADEIFPGRRGRQANREHIYCLQTAKPVRYSFFATLKPQIRMLESNMIPDLDEDGRVTRITGFVTDRTDEAALQEELILSRTVQDEMASFLSMTAHDLSTPLTHVRNLVNALRDGFQDLGDGKLQAIDELEQLATGSVQLISDLMQDVPMQPAETERSIVYLRRIIHNILAMTDPVDQHRVTCADMRLDVDETVLMVVLREIFSARFEAMPDGSLNIEVEALEFSEGWLRLSVSDDNAPMERNRAHSPYAERNMVSGQDMTPYARARRLVEARGGVLQLQEQLRGGFTATFTLPGQQVGASGPALSA